MGNLNNIKNNDGWENVEPRHERVVESKNNSIVKYTDLQRSFGRMWKNGRKKTVRRVWDLLVQLFANPRL